MFGFPSERFTNPLAYFNQFNHLYGKELEYDSHTLRYYKV